MSGALARKLSNFLPLSDSDGAYLDSITHSPETVAAGHDIICFGDLPSTMFVIESGTAIRYRVLRSGERQILSFILPGDQCDLNVFLLKKMDHSVAALDRVQLSHIKRDDVLQTYLQRPRIAAALWWSALQAEAISRERIVALGRRRARGRIAYLFVDLYWRMKSIDQAGDHKLELPLTQVEIADTLGLTPVHVNRVMKQLEREGLIQKKRGTVDLLDLDQLQREADIEDVYLHLDAPPPDVARYFERLEQGHSVAAE
jgi:CRP-like cAMP-binding protein